MLAFVSTHAALLVPHFGRPPGPRKPEVPTPSGATEGSTCALHLRPRQTHPQEHVARVLMMVCRISAAEAASLATQAGDVRVGIWERAIAEHAYEGMAAQGVLADLTPAYVHRGEALAAVKADGLALQYASPELQADREVALAAVQQRGWALECASEELRADREVALAAVRQDGWALRYASEELQADREVVLVAVQQDGRAALMYASEELRADREVALAAVQQDGLALKHASAELQADREVALAAVRQDGLALKHASEELRADREVVLAAVQQDGLALKHASAELQADREVALAAVRQDGLALKQASEELRADREVVLAAVQQNGQALGYASPELWADFEGGCVSLCAPPALPLPPTFSRTEAEEQVTALISSSPGISRHSKVTVDELQDDLLNYCIAQRTYPDRIVELKLQTEFCAIPCKNQGDLGTFLQACLFAALRTTYPPPVRGAVIPPARTSRAPRLLSLQPIQSSFAHGPARR